jgi:hypothetical protein
MQLKFGYINLSGTIEHLILLLKQNSKKSKIKYQPIQSKKSQNAYLKLLFLVGRTFQRQATLTFLTLNTVLAQKSLTSRAFLAFTRAAEHLMTKSAAVTTSRKSSVDFGKIAFCLSEIALD